MTIRLEYARFFQDRLDGGRGLPRATLATLAGRFASVRAEVDRRRGAGEYGFLALGEMTDDVRHITQFAETLGQAHDHVLVLGIGGSALGARALLSALRRPAWNEHTDEGREFYPRLTIVDNVDPASVADALRRIDPRRVLVNVISKSGGTAETLAQYLIVRDWLEGALGAAATRHLVFTTDPARGALREIGRREGIAMLDVPPGVGGRFSVLSPVGLLPAALVGIDVGALLAGARTAVAAAAGDDLLQNPAALYAALLHAADTGHGARIHALMPYSDRLRDVAEWYRQLWAESLGKRVGRDGSEVFAGPTPLAAVGATDQHSQVQLFMEGPFDKVVTFIAVDDPGTDVAIPAREGLPPDLAYLGGHTLGGLLTAEREATAAALAQHGRMNCTLRLPDLSPESVGELLMFLQLATGFAGAWYGVDPFDQPGVELAKVLTYGALGRPGFEGRRTPPPPEGDVA
ncbi:MAG TPA: glucose-6-phosphate isomerase [Gemmatimonadales bacterium]|nr:glucose-6-phosphate isomerase [Gemmatimonadales bacterium]